MTTTDQTAFFVSTKGNDSWSGRLAAPNAAGTDGPFASLEKARDAMRAGPWWGWPGPSPRGTSLRSGSAS